MNTRTSKAGALFLFSAFVVAISISLFFTTCDFMPPEPLCTVDFIADGGVPQPLRQILMYGRKIAKPADISKTGFIFAGWFSEDSFTYAWNFEEYCIFNNITLYAKWEQVIETSGFTVAFNSNGGSGVDEQTISLGGTATRPAAPTKEDYVFDDWYSDEELIYRYNFLTKVYGDITLYAKWDILTETPSYLVTFNSNEGSLVESQRIISGDTVVEPDAPTREDYIFDNWFSDEELLYRYNFSTKVYGDITLYAKWILSTYTVTFNSNGGSTVSHQMIVSGETVEQPKNPTKDHYVFDNWYSDMELTSSYSFSTPVINNITLYAKWELPFGVQFEASCLGLTPGSTTEELYLNWYAETGTGNVTQVRFIDDNNNIIVSTNGTVTAASAGYVAHKASVSGFIPNSQYRYSVSNNGTDWSYEYNYKTANTGAFRFAFVADPQLRNTAPYVQNWKNTMIKIGAAGASFIAGIGDQVDDEDGDEENYNNFFAAPELRSIPYSPAVGNHDRTYHFKYHFNVPNEQEFELFDAGGSAQSLERAIIKAAANYWYLYNRVLFVVLNTSAYPDASDGYLYMARLSKTLKTAVTACTGQYDWLFVQHHKSTRSIAEHALDEDIKQYIDSGFEDLMDEHNVDFVLAGHDHVYARSYALKGGEVVNTEKHNIVNPGGAIYLTGNTASGIHQYDIIDPIVWEYYTNVGIQDRKPHYTIIDVNGNTVTFNVYNSDSDIVPIDYFTVTK